MRGLKGSDKPFVAFLPALLVARARQTHLNSARNGLSEPIKQLTNVVTYGNTVWEPLNPARHFLHGTSSP